VSETTTAGTSATPAATASLVDTIYAAVPCLAQNGNQPCAPEAVTEAGAGGPALLYWQATGYTLNAPILAGMQPQFNKQGDGSLAASCFFNENAVRLPLLRRRALLSPQPPGESLVMVYGSEYCVTDPSDTITMAMLNLGIMSAPPQVRLSAVGMADGSNNVYTAQVFSSDGGPLVISIDATAWSTVPDQAISALLYLDGEPVAEIGLFANPSSFHLPLVGADWVLYNVAAGGHQLDLVGNTGTTVDDGDVWSLTVMEMTGTSVATPLFSGPPAQQQGGGTLATATYEARGGEQLFLVSLSGWSGSDNEMLSAQLLVEGDPVGTLQTWASKGGMHLPIAGGDIAPGVLMPGTQQIELVAGPNTITDQNDRLSITVIEVFR